MSYSPPAMLSIFLAFVSMRCMANTSFLISYTYRSLFVSALVPIAPTATYASATRIFKAARLSGPSTKRVPKLNVSSLLLRYYVIFTHIQD